MKITPAMIMDTLGAFSAVSQLPQDHSFQFDGIHLLSARTEHPDPEFLYIGTSSQVSAVSPSILHEICIVCIGTPEHSKELLREAQCQSDSAAPGDRLYFLSQSPIFHL